MNIKSLDPFTRTGGFLADRLKLDDFGKKRFAKAWWALFIVAMACAIRYWRYGDHLLALLIGTAAFLTYWRNWRFGSFRCSWCRHIKGPEDLGCVVSGAPDALDPLERVRIWSVLAVFAASCLASLWSTLVSGIVPVAAFAALSALEWALARRGVDGTAQKKCCACVAKHADIDDRFGRFARELDSFREGIGLKKEGSSFPTVPHPMACPVRSEAEGDLEIFIER